MTIVVAYIACVVAFLVIDYFALSYVIKPVFDRALGDWMLESPRFGPAGVFYLFYVVGVCFFVVSPALAQEWSGLRVFLTGALLGAVAYGTYEFSNLATLKRWTPTLVAMDFTWGAVLTGVVASVGVWAGGLVGG